MKKSASAAAERMREEGVNCKGFGVLPKFPMLDTEIELGAKALYAYFCSHRGKEDIVFPSRERILHDLKINKDTYYRYLRQLTENDYISVKKMSNEAGAFANNAYTIVAHPAKFSSRPEKAYLAKSYALIKAGGIEAAGRGAVPKSVMLDERVSVKAKGVYAYLCAFAGAGSSVSPKQENMLRHLGISYNSLSKYLRELRTFNLLLVSQRYTDGKLSCNDYILVRNPDIARAVTEHTITVSDTDGRRSRKSVGFFDEKQFADFSDTEKQDIKKQDAGNADANNNSPKTITNFNSNSVEQSIREAAAKQGSAAPDKRLMEEKKPCDEEILTGIAGAGELPYSYCSDSDTIYSALTILTKASCPPDTADRAERQRYRLFLRAMTEMLDARGKPTRIRGARLGYAKAVEALNGRIYAGFDAYGDAFAEAHELYECVSDRYIRASAKTEIKNPLGYMKAMIWTELTTDMVEIDGKIKYARAAGE